MSGQDLPDSGNSVEPANENFESLAWAFVYGKRHPVTTGLTWGYWGGRWGGFAVSDGSVTLTDDTTNYIVVQRSDGVLSVSATSTNWDDTTNYARVYKIVTASGVVSGTPEDHRAGPNGIFG